MSETNPDFEAGEAPSSPGGRIGWRRRVMILLLLAGGVGAVTHSMHGSATRVWVIIGLAVAVLALLIFYPRLMRHFHPFGRRPFQQRRRRSALRSPGSRGRRAGSGMFRRSGSSGRGSGLFRGRGSGTSRRRSSG